MSEMRIYKAKGGFAIVPNILVENPNISALAKAIYAYMGGRPEGWVLRTTDIFRKFKESKNTIRKGINELIENRYIYRFKEYEAGRKGIVKWHYIVVDKPSSKEEAIAATVPKGWELNKILDIPKKTKIMDRQVAENTESYLEPKNLVLNNLELNNLELKNRDTYKEHYYKKHSRKKKTSFSSMGNSCRSFPILEFNFISDNGKPLAKDSWCGTYVLKTQAERPILNIVSRLSRQKVKPDPVAIEEVVNYWNSFADRCKHNDLQVVRHNLATSKVLYKIQVLVTDILAAGTTTNGIKKAIDNFEDLLLRSPHYSNNRRFDLPMFLIMPQSDPGRLFEDCLTGGYATSKRYFPTNYKKTLKDFVDTMISREKSANGYIPDMARDAIINDLAPSAYFDYLMKKGGDKEKCRAIVVKERKKLLTYF